MCATIIHECREVTQQIGQYLANTQSDNIRAF